MPKIKTTRGTLVNNTGAHKITDDNATIFNFCIDSVTLDDDTLTVACTTLLGDTVEYSLDISSDTKALPSVLENLNVAGDVNLFLAVAYRIYEAGLEPSDDIPSGDCAELQERIAELEALINPDILSVYDINLAELSITKLNAGFNDSMISGGEIQVELYSGTDNVLLPNLNQVISVLDVKVNDESVTINQSAIGNLTQKTCIHCGVSFTDVEYNDSPIPVSVTIKNNQTNKQYTITDSISVENGQIVLNGGGTVVTNYGAEWNVRVQPTNDSPLVLTLDLQTSKMINNLDTVGANSLVAFKLNNEAIPTSQTQSNLSDYGANYTITIPLSDLEEGDNIISCQILESDDTYPITLEYTYNTTGGGELTLKPYVEFTNITGNLRVGSMGSVTSNLIVYNNTDEELIDIETITDTEIIGQTGDYFTRQITPGIKTTSSRSIPLLAGIGVQEGTIHYTTRAILRSTGEVLNTINGTVQVTTT